MSIQEIIQSGANVSITIGTNDLLQFAYLQPVITQ